MNDSIKHNTREGATITVILNSEGETKAVELQGKRYYREEDGYLGYVLVPYDSALSVTISELPDDIVLHLKRKEESQQILESLEVAVEKKSVDEVLVSFSTSDTIAIWHSPSYLMLFAELLKIRLDRYKEKHPEIQYDLDIESDLYLYVSFPCRGETIGYVLKSAEWELREILRPLQGIDDIVSDELDGV